MRFTLALTLLFTCSLSRADEPPRLVVQTGHGSGISAGLFSPDGKIVASASADGVKLWDVASGREVRTLHHAQARSIAFAPDGRMLASGSGDRTIKLWDVRSGREIRSLSEKREGSGWGLTGEGQGLDAFDAVQFSPDGKLLVSGGGMKIKLWDVEGGLEIRTLSGHQSFVTSVAFSADGQRIVSAGDDNSVKVWDAARGNELLSLVGHTGEVNFATFSPDGRLVASASDDKCIKLWDALSGKEIRTLTGHDSKVTSVAFATDGKSLISGSWDETVRYWDVSTGTQLKSVEGTHGSVNSLAISRDGKILAGSDHVLTIWDADSARKLHSLGGLGDQVNGVALSGDGRAFASSLGKTVRVWDLVAGRESRILGGDGSLVRAIGFSQDSRVLAAGDMGNVVTMWNMATGQKMQTLSSHQSTVNAVAFSPDGGLLVSGSSDGTAILWDTKTGAALKTLGEPDRKLSSVNAVEISPDGRLVAIGSSGALSLWRIDGSKLDSQAGGVKAVAFSPKANVIASLQGGGSDAIQLWEVASNGQLLKQKRFFHSLAETLAFSPDGKLIATGGLDRSVKLWDVDTGVALRTLEGHDLYVKTLDFSPDGQYLVSGSSDGTSRFWRTDDGAALARLVSFNDGTWAVTDAQGRFDASDLETISGLHWVMPDDPLMPVPVEAFMRDYYEPRLLPRILAGESFKPLPPLSDLNRVQPLVRIMSVLPDAADSNVVNVTVEAGGARKDYRRGDKVLPISTAAHDLRLFRDGQLVGYIDDLIAPAEAKSVIRTFPVRLPLARSGERFTLSAYAFNDDRVKSPTVRQSYLAQSASSSVAKPRAILLNIGVDLYQNKAWDLGFAASDAHLIGDTLAARMRATGRYREVVPLLLVSDVDTPEAASKEKIRDALQQLAGSGSGPASLPKAGPDDVVIVSFSGHGAIDDEGRFYLLPHDIGEGQSRLLTPEVLSSSISSDELSSWMRDIDAGELVLIIDACHSAASIDQAGFKPGPMGSRGLGQLAFDKGMRILAATQASDVALESDSTQHGLLSYALVKDGIEAGLADFKPANESITLAEWLAYGVQRVPSLTQEVLADAVNSRGASRPKVINGRNAAVTTRQTGLQQPSLFDFRKRGVDVEIVDQ